MASEEESVKNKEENDVVEGRNWEEHLLLEEERLQAKRQEEMGTGDIRGSPHEGLDDATNDFEDKEESYIDERQEQAKEILDVEQQKKADMRTEMNSDVLESDVSSSGRL